MNVNERDLILGTSFPDIRYLGLVAREQTHVESSLSYIEACQTLPTFELGVWLHIRLDRVREDFYEKRGIYDKVSKEQAIFNATKLIEDELSFNIIGDMNKYGINFL